MKYFSLLLLLISCTFSIAQRTITGTVIDGNAPLLGVTILIKGTDKATTTDFDGNYSIVVNNDDILSFSYAGYETQEIIVKKQTVIDIIMGEGLDCNLPTLNTLSISRGINYNTTGIAYQNYYKVLPLNGNLNIGYATDFNHNSDFNLKIGKDIRLDSDFYIDTNIQFQTADFNDFQYHSYKLSLAKSFKLSKKHNFINLQIISGYLNYSSRKNSKRFGYGFGLEKYTRYNFRVSSSFIHWQEFNELNVHLSYSWKRWRLITNYRHLSNYEEFQMGIGYSFYF